MPPLPPADLSQPGWQVQQGQAVWRPNARTQEIAGELVVATRPDGSAIIQFLKTPFALVLAQTTPTQWEIEFVPQQRVIRRLGRPPARLGWLHLPRVLLGGPPPDAWRFERRAGGHWLLENPATGEKLEGFLSP